MPSSPTTRNRLIKQAAGEGLNSWGTLLNSGAFDLIDAALDGWTIKALTADYTLTTANYSADEARSRVLKFTGTGSYTVTIPSLEKVYLVWNALSGNVTLTTGAGTTAVLPTGAVTFVICDGTNVKPMGYGGLELKAYIDAAVLAATGSLPATTGNEGKSLIVAAGAWVPTLLTLANISDYSTAAASDIWAGTSSTKVVTPAALQNANASQALTDASTVTMSLASGPNATWQLTSAVGGSRTMAAPTNCAVNDFISLKVVQPASGGPCTVTWNACFDWMANGTPTLSTGASKEDMVWGQVVAVDGSNVATKIKAVFGLAA